MSFSHARLNILVQISFALIYVCSLLCEVQHSRWLALSFQNKQIKWVALCIFFRLSWTIVLPRFPVWQWGSPPLSIEAQKLRWLAYWAGILVASLSPHCLTSRQGLPVTWCQLASRGCPESPGTAVHRVTNSPAGRAAALSTDANRPFISNEVGCLVAYVRVLFFKFLFHPSGNERQSSSSVATNGECCYQCSALCWAKRGREKQGHEIQIMDLSRLDHPLAGRPRPGKGGGVGGRANFTP